MTLATALSIVCFTPTVRAATSGVLYTFQGANDGANPAGSLLEVGGVFYGTTAQGGGTGCGGGGCGTVFSLTPGGVEKVLYAFQGAKDGTYPAAGLIKVGNKLYGTTRNAPIGTPPICNARAKWAGCGTVFSVTISGAHKVLHIFKGRSDGLAPMGNLLNVDGLLYGTTQFGGTDAGGIVFSITPAGIEKVVYNIPGATGPQDGLINVGGTLYGTADNHIFATTTSGVGSAVYGFDGGTNGTDPLGALVDVNGLLYGTTAEDGKEPQTVCCGNGTVFKLSLTTKQQTPIYAFNGGADGTASLARLIYVSGTLYGTTSEGGGAGCGSVGCGTVFSVTRAGVEKVLATFGTGNGGGTPVTSLINYKGTLYGTASRGGQGTGCGAAGCGTVFWVKP